LHAIERDLRRRYGEQYRIMGADSGQSALEIVRHLKLRGDVVSLFLVDQRMPRMTGVEFLAKGIKDFPRAKRVLLTAYADTEAAINAINEVQIDHYLIKPWDPPEERLYPVLDDLLEHWLGGHHPQFEGIRVIGQKWSPQAHEVKYSWRDIRFHLNGLISRLMLKRGLWWNKPEKAGICRWCCFPMGAIYSIRH
jgi:thioredoxin reductase (NADPH)